MTFVYSLSILPSSLISTAIETWSKELLRIHCWQNSMSLSVNSLDEIQFLILFFMATSLSLLKD